MTYYKARIEKDEDGRRSAWIEELPGCAVWGYTRDEALAAIEDATDVYLEDMADAGEVVPHEYTVVMESRGVLA